MHPRPLLLIIVLPFLFTTCSDNSSGPATEEPATFSRMMWSPGNNTFASDCVVMANGLRVVIGQYQDALHITGSPDTMVASGGSDAFLAAFRADGSLAWKNHVGGGVGGVAPNAISRDGGDGLYIAGFTLGNVSLGGTDYIGGGTTDLLLARLDATGNLIWAAVGIGPASDVAQDVAVAADGGVYVCGSVSSEIILAGEDLGEFGSPAGFLAKIHSSGSGGWTVTGYGAGPSSFNGVVRCDDGSVLVCGNYSASALDIGGEILPLDGDGGSFIARFAANGDPLGNIRTGGTGSAVFYRVTHINNEPVVAGFFYDTVDFDVTAAGGEVTSQGLADAFIARYTEDGALSWVKTFGDSDGEFGISVARSGTDLLLLGSFEEYVPLGSRILLSRGMHDFFLARFDGSGALRSSKQIGSAGYEEVGSVAAGGGSVLVVGRTESDITFPDGSVRPVRGLRDGFVYQEP